MVDPKRTDLYGFQACHGPGEIGRNSDGGKARGCSPIVEIA
jgi:hypothetical protein